MAPDGTSNAAGTGFLLKLVNGVANGVEGILFSLFHFLPCNRHFSHIDSRSDGVNRPDAIGIGGRRKQNEQRRTQGMLERDAGLVRGQHGAGG